MPYQVTQGLRGCYLPDHVVCFATLDEAKAYMNEELYNIQEHWPYSQMAWDFAVYGPSYQYAIVIEEVADCEETADFNDRDHGGQEVGHWEIQTSGSESSENLDNKIRFTVSAHNLEQAVKEVLSDIQDTHGGYVTIRAGALGALALGNAQRAWVGYVTYPGEDEVSHVDVYATWWPGASDV